ncbi:hypothetical protein KY290_004249 [Solanum tuberosum]|uniref:Protein kinase domain-containing protein n=1 Tax=Solanum tuberosum TaxID=4113 RepID=A0ABQ7WWM0_SOLTU|nr:hypothetical protein KY290_004249 [Solanum tuberosum]
MQISINSYRLQGIKKSAQRFVPIPFAPDGLTEEFYDLHAYNPAESKFIMKLQVHPERMSQEDSHGFDLLIRKLTRSQGMTGKNCLPEPAYKMNTCFWCANSCPEEVWKIIYSENLRMKVTLKAAKGLTYLHSAEAKIIYQDFKSSNILLAANYNAKFSQSRVKWIPSVMLLPSI